MNHPDAEVFEISYRELALEFLRIYWPQAKAYPRADNSSVKDAVLRQSFGGSNALVISLIQVFQERLCPADAQWLTFLQAQRFEKDFDRLVKDCQTRVLKKNPLQYMQGYEFLFDKDDRTNRIYVRREVAVLLCRFQPIVQELIFRGGRRCCARSGPIQECLARRRNPRCATFCSIRIARKRLRTFETC